MNSVNKDWEDKPHGHITKYNSNGEIFKEWKFKEAFDGPHKHGSKSSDQDACREKPQKEIFKEFGTPYKFDPEYSGPIKRRACTDIICLIGFLGFIYVWAMVAMVGFANGDIDKIIYPTNSMGEICGKGAKKDRPLLLFFDIVQCLSVASLATGCSTPQVCVKDCPTVAFSGLAIAKDGKDEEAKKGMQAYCSNISEEMWNKKSAQQLIKEGYCPAWVLPSRSYFGWCLPLGMNANASLPDEEIVSSNGTTDDKTVTSHILLRALDSLGIFFSARDIIERVVTDIYTTKWLIAKAYLAAFAITFIWVCLLQYITGFMIWMGMALVIAKVGGLFWYSLMRYQAAKDVSDLQKNIFQINLTPFYFNDVLALTDTWLVSTVVLGIGFLCLFLILIFLRHRIKLAVELIKEGSKAISQVSSTLFWPIFPLILHATIFVWFGGVACFLHTSSDTEYKIHYNKFSLNPKITDGVTLDSRANSLRIPNITEEAHSADLSKMLACPHGYCINPETKIQYMPNDACDPEQFKQSGCEYCNENIDCHFTEYEKDKVYTWMSWFNLFGFYWAMSFITAFSEMVLGGVFAKWYWTWDKKHVPSGWIFTSLINTTVYHLGTIAFGSLIISITRIIRGILSYLDKKLRKYENGLVRFGLRLCKCCLWCFDRFIRFVNTNVYIMCAMKGTNFLASAKDSFHLLMRNVGRVMALDYVVRFVLFLSQLVIVVGIGMASYLLLNPEGRFPITDTAPILNYNATPIIMIVIGTYVITNSFFGVYSMAVNTLFLCLLEDMERNDGTPDKPYFMSINLQKILGTVQKWQIEQKNNRLEHLKLLEKKALERK